MKFKKLVIVSSIASLLFLLAYMKNIAQKRQEFLIETTREISDYDLMQGLNEGFISRVIIYKGSDEKNKVILARDSSAGGWVLQNKFGARARKDLIDNFVKQLGELKGEIRADSKNVFEDFAITDSQGVHVVLESEGGKTLKHLVFTLLRPDWNKNFVRLQDSGKIVLVKKDILSLLNLYSKDAKLDDKNFADLKMFSFDPKQINKIDLNMNNKEQLVLVRKESADKNAGPIWNFAPSKLKGEIDTSKIDEFLINLSNMQAQEIVDPNQSSYGFDRALLRIVLEDSKAEKAVQMQAGDYIDSQKAYYVKVIPQNQVYEVPESLIQNLKKDRVYFLKVKNVKNGKSAGKKDTPKPKTARKVMSK